MRAFANPRLLPYSLGGAALITLSCTPNLYRYHPELARPGVVVMLAVLSLIMWQGRRAWTPPAVLRAPEWRTWPLWPTVLVAATLAALGAVSMLAINPHLLEIGAYVPPQTRQEALLGLPWHALFLPLALVAFPYAVAYRVTKRQHVALAVVFVFVLLGMWQQLGHLAVPVRWGIMAVRLPHVVMLTALYPRLGYWGLVVLAAFTWSRYLLWPGM